MASVKEKTKRHFEYFVKWLKDTLQYSRVYAFNAVFDLVVLLRWLREVERDS